MDKLVIELLNLLREMLASQQTVLRLTFARREAMRTFDIKNLEKMVELERTQMASLTALENRRLALVAQFKVHLGRHVEPNITEISRRIGEPQKSQLLCLAAEIKKSVELVDRNTRINATISETVVKGMAKILKIVTGMAQHAGLYMRNGRKQALHGIHLLEVTG